MDTASQQPLQASSPPSSSAPSESNLPKNILKIIGIILIIGSIILVLIYMKIIPIPQQAPTIQRVTFACPVIKEDCNQAQTINLDQTATKKSGSALVYKLDSGSKLYTAISGKTIPDLAPGDETTGIPNHAKITIEGNGQFQGYTAHYEFFGLAGENVQTVELTQNTEIGTIYGGYPKGTALENINLIFYVEFNGTPISISTSDLQ